MKKFKTKEELSEEVDAAKKYYFEKPEDLFDQIGPHLIKKYLLQQEAPQISKASNSATTVDKFEGHQNYKELVNDWNYPRGLQDNLLYDNRLDIWYKQPFYGRVCNKNNLIYTNYFIYRNIAEKGADPICVFDFVAKAFENMKKIFGNIKLSPNSQHLKELKAVFGPNSTIRLEKKYMAHLDQVFSEFMNSDGFDLRYSSRIGDYSGFYKTFVDFVINNDITFTFTGFAESLGADIYDSYLAFDVKETDPENSDADKLEFLDDLNYPAYAYAARESGFAIDPNKPWRLIADVTSDRFMQAIKDTVADYILEMQKLDESAGDDKPGWFELLRIVRKTMDDNTEEMKKALKKLEEAKALKGETDKLLEDRGEAIEEATEGMEEEIKMYLELLDSIRLYFKYDPGAGEAIKKKEGLKNKAALIFNVRYSYQSFFNKKEQEFKTLKELLKRSLDQLSFVFITPTPTQAFYEQIYYNIYDYQFFSYFPRKLIEFYNEYRETYPFSGNVSTSENEAFSKFEKVARPTRTLNQEKAVAAPGSALYDVKYIRDYARMRNSENNSQISLSQLQLLFNELKSLFSGAEAHVGKPKKFLIIKNTIVQLIELIFGTPNNQNLPIDTWLKDVKNDTLFLFNETWNNFEKPKLLLERLCISPDEDVVPTLEPEACAAPFPGALPPPSIPKPSGPPEVVCIKCPPPLTPDGDEDCPEGTLWSFDECKCLKVEKAAPKDDWDKKEGTPGCKEPPSGCPDGSIFVDENGKSKGVAGESIWKCVCVDKEFMDECKAPMGGCEEGAAWDPFICKCKVTEKYGIAALPVVAADIIKDLKIKAIKPGTAATPGWFAVRKDMEALEPEIKAYLCEKEQTALATIALMLAAGNVATGISYENFYEFMVGNEKKKITGWLNCICGKGKLGCKQI